MNFHFSTPFIFMFFTDVIEIENMYSREYSLVLNLLDGGDYALTLISNNRLAV
jgi:hypothetical protein